MRLVVFGLFLALMASRDPAAFEERAIEIEMVLDANVERVWDTWTTEEGVRSFFAPDCNIDLRVDGLYEIYFAPDAPPGRRGADGMRILVLEPKKRFAFTWNAPLDQPWVRAQRTHVTLHFESLGERQTRMRLVHGGWGTGADWDRAFEYFEAAWRRTVLPRLMHALEKGPIDWNNLPELAPVRD